MSTFIVCNIHVGTCLHQEANDFIVSSIGCIPQRSPTSEKPVSDAHVPPRWCEICHAHRWIGEAELWPICALRAAAQRTALRTKWELQTAHAVPAVCSALCAARAAPHARCAPYLRSYIPCVLRCMYATRHTVLHALKRQENRRKISIYSGCPSPQPPRQASGPAVLETLMVVH